MWISGEGCPGKGTASAKALGNPTKASGGVTEEGGDGDGRERSGQAEPCEQF